MKDPLDNITASSTAWKQLAKIIPSESPAPDDMTTANSNAPEPPKEDRKKRSRLIAAVVAIVLGLSALIGGLLFGGSAEQWKKNELRSDAVPYQSSNHWDQDDEAGRYPVFGSAFMRKQISSVTILDTLEDAPIGAWDVSVSGNDTVMAWVKPNGELYDLYIGAEGGVNASGACKDLFAGYSNVKSITLGDAFHTDGAVDMSRMFFGCFSLKELRLDGFETRKVTDMSYMFCYCQALEKLNVNDFDTRNVQNMCSMFSWCQSLIGLNLNHFDTANVTNMKEMFYCCESLQYLDIGSFDTAAVQDMTDIFYHCPQGADHQHLLH